MRQAGEVEEGDKQDISNREEEEKEGRWRKKLALRL